MDKEEAVLRASADSVTKQKQNYLNDPDPGFLTYGPRNRREFLNLMKWTGGGAA